MAQSPRRILLLLVTLLLVAVAAFLVWLPFDPLEDPAGPLDALLPRDVDSAWRCDGPSLLQSPLARAVWDRPAVAALRTRWDVEERLLAPMRRIEAAVADASLGLAEPPSLETDLIPAEVVVATRGDDILVATRISSRARAVELIRRLPAKRRAQLGIRIDGRCLVFGEDRGAPFWVARHRDVLLASTSRPLLDAALANADSGAASLATAPGYDDALHLARPAGLRIFGWVRPGAVVRRLGALDGNVATAGQVDGAADVAAVEAPDAPVWRATLVELLRAPDAAPLRIELDLSAKDALTTTWRLHWNDDLPAALAPLSAPAAPDAPSLARRARDHAVPDETIAAGGLTASASSVLRALLASQPPERQDAFEAALAAAGESIDGVAKSLAAHFDDGVGFLVARLRETDEVLRGDDAGLVHAIPATLVVFRLHGAGADRAVLDGLNRRAETLFGRPLGDTVEVLGDGTRIHTLRRTGLAGQWDLLRPAFAFHGDEFIFSTHEGFLRRALAHETGGADAPPETGGRTLALDLAAAPLRRWVGDQAWEAADRATWRDWGAERRRIEASIPKDSPLRPADRVAYVDARIREIKRVRREREIPAAVEDWRRRWEWLEHFGDARATVEIRGADAEVRVRLQFADTR